MMCPSDNFATDGQILIIFIREHMVQLTGRGGKKVLKQFNKVFGYWSSISKEKHI